MNSTQLEKIILTSLLNDGDYSRVVMPHVKSDFFSTNEAATVTSIILEYTENYNSLPSQDSLEVELENRKGVSGEIFTNAKVLITSLFKQDIIDGIAKLDNDWLLDKTEAYFKQQSCYAAVLNSISILEGDNKTISADAIPSILEEALNITFDNDIGHDYFEDSEERFEYYHRTDVRIPFLLQSMNNVTNGGAIKKSLVVPVAPTGVGKSLFMTAWSAFLLKLGYNVLYVTLEMAEEKIAERVDACLLDIAVNDLKTVPHDIFTNKINQLRGNYIGKLKIKEASSMSFTAITLKSLLGELKAKNNFKPDIIMVDYLNLVGSIRQISASDTYNAVKAAASELRSIAMEEDLVICAPTQTNREGVGADDFSLTEISESMGIAHYSDFIFGIIETPELLLKSQWRIKQMKNRWGDISKPSSFVVSTNKAKMQISDYDEIEVIKPMAPKRKANTPFPIGDVKPMSLGDIMF